MRKRYVFITNRYNEIVCRLVVYPGHAAESERMQDHLYSVYENTAPWMPVQHFLRYKKSHCIIDHTPLQFPDNTAEDVWTNEQLADSEPEWDRLTLTWLRESSLPSCIQVCAECRRLQYPAMVHCTWWSQCQIASQILFECSNGVIGPFLY